MDFLKRLFKREDAQPDTGSQTEPPTVTPASEADPSPSDTSTIAHRTQLAVESLLGNESLTDELDDSAAQVLLEWGIACAERIMGATKGLADADAETLTYPRLRAVRRLMRDVNRWMGQLPSDSMQAKEHAQALDKVIEQARVIYGDTFSPPDTQQRTAFLESVTAENPQPQTLIMNLRTLLESNTHT